MDYCFQPYEKIQYKKEIIVDEIDKCIKNYNSEALTLQVLSCRLGYSEYFTTRKFKEISGMQFRDYLRHRKLAFALKEVRDSEKSLLDIALDYGFSSHEAFTRTFKGTYGITPSKYRKNPKIVVLRTKINSFDRYLLGLGEIGMIKSTDGIKIYFITIPAHKFLHIKNYESNGYWDFWQKQSLIPGQNYETICGFLLILPALVTALILRLEESCIFIIIQNSILNISDQCESKYNYVDVQQESITF